MIVTISQLKVKYKNYSNPLDKIKRENSKGNIFRLTKGIYETNPNVNPYFLASSILSPSYLSFDWTLSFYGLIPERVMVITSTSLNIHKKKSYINYFNRYECRDIPKVAFSEVLTYLEESDYIVKIAIKEKAICNSLSKWRVVRNIKYLKELLFIDKRIKIDEFRTCDFNLMSRLTSLYHKTNLDLLNKLIKKNFINNNFLLAVYHL